MIPSPHTVIASQYSITNKYPVLQTAQILLDTGHEIQFGSVQGFKIQAPTEMTYPVAQTIQIEELVQLKQFVREVLQSLQVLMASI